MNINKFAVLVSKQEGKKKQINIAQIKEVLKVANELSKGSLYTAIRNLKVLVILFSLTLCSCKVTFEWSKKPEKEKTYGKKLDEKLLQEIFNHWKFIDVTGGLHPQFTTVADSTCTVTRKLLFEKK